MTQFGIQNQFPPPLMSGGWRKLGRILMTAFETQTRFSQTVVNRGRGCGKESGEKQRHCNTMTT